jgi:hypothetical protein
MKPHYITAVKRRQKIFDFVISALVSVAFALFLAVILIEWMSGCGEGGECVFIPVNNPETQPQKLDTTSRFVV